MISTEGLTKNFRSYTKAPGIKGTLQSFLKRDYLSNSAVSNFDLDVNSGEFIGLLGPNGAGKTTLMKMLTGIIVPSSGRVVVNGHEPFRRQIEFRKKIALVMGQKSQLWWDIPALDSFHLLKHYYEISHADFKKRLDELTSALNIGRQLQVHVRKLSLGERMKMELMASLLHQPDVIFLDEPTIGLDVVAQKGIREFLAMYQKRHGTTIVLTSHYMADVQALCERIVLILDGCKTFDGPLSEFEGLLGREKFVSIRFDQSIESKERDYFSDLDPNWNESHTQVEVRIKEENLRDRTVAILNQYPVVDFHTEKLPIERVMHRLLAKPDLLGSPGVAK